MQMRENSVGFPLLQYCCSEHYMLRSPLKGRIVCMPFESISIKCSSDDDVNVKVGLLNEGFSSDESKVACSPDVLKHSLLLGMSLLPVWNVFEHYDFDLAITNCSSTG